MKMKHPSNEAIESTESAAKRTKEFSGPSVFFLPNFCISARVEVVVKVQSVQLKEQIE